MTSHLKRIAAPRTWGMLDRKENKFTLRPHPSGHSMEFTLALGTVLRDYLGLAGTMAEAQKLCHANEVLVDGKRRKDRRATIGLFDVLSIPTLKKQWRVTLDAKGRLIVEELAANAAGQKVARVVGKTMLAGGKLQLNLYDGKNILVGKDQKVRVGDSVVISLPDLKVKKVLALEEGATVFLVKGKHAGATGTLKSVVADTAKYLNADKEEIETSKRYLFVVEN